jgi:hypothetical protein
LRSVIYKAAVIAILIIIIIMMQRVTKSKEFRFVVTGYSTFIHTLIYVNGVALVIGAPAIQELM